MARENDVRLMIAEWEEASKEGLHAADHFIRDLNYLIQ